MATVFLFAAGPGGYRYISEAKWIVFCTLGGLYFAALLVWAAWKKPRLLRRSEPAQMLLLAYLLLTMLGALCSPWRGTALLGGSRCDGALSAALYVLTALALGTYAKPGKMLLYAAAAAMTLFCLVCVLQLCDRNPLGLFPGEFRWSGREDLYNGAFLGFTGNADLTAAVLCMGFAAFLGAAISGAGFWFALPALLCGLVLTWSGLRGGMLGAVGGLLLALPGLRSWTEKQTWVYAAVLALLLAAGLAAVFFLPLGGTLGELHAILHGEASDDFGSGRIYIWRNVLPLLRERPLLGSGADTLGVREDLKFLKTLSDGRVLSRKIDCAHCEYLNVAVNQGIPALLCLVGGTAAALLRGRRRGRSAAILRAAVFAYAVQALTGITMPGSTAFFWLCLGLLMACCRTDDESDTNAEKGKKKWILRN